jgi:hypothetical protein
LWFTQVLLTFVLVSSVTHADPAVGSDGFWMTRPIAPRALVASKLTLLFIAGGPVFSVLVVLAAIAAITEQYQRRALLRSVAALVVGVGLAAVLSSAWPWPLLAQRLEVPSWATTQALQLTVDEATIGTDNTHNVFMRRGGRLSAVAGAMTLSGIEPGWSAFVVLRNASVTVGSKTLQGAAGIVSAQLSLGGPGAQNSDVMTRVLGVRAPGESRTPQVERQTLFAALRPYATSTGRYHGDFSVAFTHHVIEATLPLQPGAKHAAPAFRVVVDGVSRLRGDAVVTIRESRASSLYDRRPFAFYTYYHRNRERQEAATGTEADASGQF